MQMVGCRLPNYVCPLTLEAYSFCSEQHASDWWGEGHENYVHMFLEAWRKCASCYKLQAYKDCKCCTRTCLKCLRQIMQKIQAAEADDEAALAELQSDGMEWGLKTWLATGLSTPIIQAKVRWQKY